MARKNANSSPGVWLGLLLVLVVHTLALNTYFEKVPELKGSPINDDSNKDNTFLDLDNKSIDTKNVQKTVRDDAKDSYMTKGINEKSPHATESSDENNASLAGTLKKTNIDQITTTVKTEHDHSTLQENETIPTIATIDFEKHLTRSHSAETVNNTKEAGGIEAIEARVNRTDDTIIQESRRDEKPSTTSHQEFEFIEEHHNFEEHTDSGLAEATTPSSKLFSLNHQVLEDTHKNIELFDIEQSDDHEAGNKATTSLVNDIIVNYANNNTRQFHENNSSVSINNNGVSSGHGPKHDVEIFKNSPHPTILRISEDTGSDAVNENTTPYYSSSSKPKGRTISITGDNDLSTKKPKNLNHSEVDQSASDTITRIFPKKSTSTQKPTELKPYPYLKSETNFTDHELLTETPNNTEKSTEEISAYENTIGRKKSDDKIVVTEPSVLVENSIQQFKPVHNKRSGNSSRVNSTFDTTVTSTAWSLATTEDLTSKNATEVTEESQTTIPDNGNRSHINNDVPQDNPNKSITTERSPVILSEVTENNIETAIGKINGTYNLTASTPVFKKLTERSEITAEDIAEDTSQLTKNQVLNSTDKIETVSNGSGTSNEIRRENEDSNTTLTKFNVTDGSTEYPLSGVNFTTSTEIHRTSTSIPTEKLSLEVETSGSVPITISATTETIQESSTEMPTSQSTETEPTEENVTDVTELDTIHVSRESTKSMTESMINQTTSVEYEFVELTTPGASSTISQDGVASAEKTNATTDFPNETSQTTESQETVITDSSIEQNETTFPRNDKTVDSEVPASSTTIIFDTTTSSNSNSEVTTNEDLLKTTNLSVSESSFTTDFYTDTTLPSTSFNANASHGRVDVTTIGQTDDLEDTTTTIFTETILPTEETTTISNIEVIVHSETTSTLQTPTTVTQGTTLQIQSTSELPEFPISSDDVTLFVRIVIEGSWTDVCPVLNNLRLSLANLLTEGTDRTVLPRNIVLHQTQCSLETVPSTSLTPIVLYVVNDDGDFDYAMTEILPSLYKKSPFVFSPPIRSVEKLVQTESSNNAIAVVAVSSVAFICLVLLAGLLFIMRKRQTRFNYGERCRPVSLDAFRVDSVSAYNSVRRKGLTRASKRSYGNPAFEDSSVTPTHPLNFAGLSSFCNDSNAITEEFEGIPQVTARMDELPAGSEVKNRYANVAPLPETRVLLQKINNEPLTEYINASYVRGPKNATKYYIACQAPMESTVSDFWRMIWEQQSKVIIMLTDIIENGVEKCVEYIPPSEVTDCHRLYGDYQVTLKKREAKEKYAISTLHLKNLENNTYREVSHIWYLWPTNGVPSNGTGLIAILLEARALQRGAPGPIVVHCSPGTGRTGTLIALDLGIRQYEITRTVDVPRVVYTIRRDRAGSVQTKEQYDFIYKALNLYAAKLAGGALESM